MADNSLNTLSVKRYVSTNDKADLLDKILHEHKILLKVVKGHPNVLAEYINAVKKGELPAHPADRMVTNPKPTDVIINIGQVQHI